MTHFRAWRAMCVLPCNAAMARIFLFPRSSFSSFFCFVRESSKMVVTKVNNKFACYIGNRTHSPRGRYVMVFPFFYNVGGNVEFWPLYGFTPIPLSSWKKLLSSCLASHCFSPTGVTLIPYVEFSSLRIFMEIWNFCLHTVRLVFSLRFLWPSGVYFCLQKLL